MASGPNAFRVLSSVMMIYGTLAVCAICAAAIVYRHDLYEQEPLHLLCLTAALGGMAMWFSAFTEEITFRNLQLTSSYGMAIVAAIEEEFLKVFVVILIAVLARKEFEDPMDGIVYGSMSGLGMAIEESIHYLNEVPAGTLILPPAELVRVCGHLVMGGISGFAVAWTILRLNRWPLAVAVCLPAAIKLHFGWDWIVLSMEDGVLGPSAAWAGSLLMMAGLIFYAILTGIASEQSRILFASGTPSRLWGWPFNRRRSP